MASPCSGPISGHDHLTVSSHGTIAITDVGRHDERFIMEQERLHLKRTRELSNLLYDLCLVREDHFAPSAARRA